MANQTYQPEAELKNQLIKQLGEQGYEKVVLLNHYRS